MSTLEEKFDQLLESLATSGVFVPIVSESRELSYGQTIRSPEDAYRAVMRLFPEMKHWQQETVVLLCLDAQGRVIWHGALFVGTLCSAITAPREIFRRALMENAAAILLAHNHPGGSTKPSSQDWAVTRRILSVGEALGIAVNDHIIISSEEGGKWTSIREHNGGTL